MYRIDESEFEPFEGRQHELKNEKLLVNAAMAGMIAGVGDAALGEALATAAASKSPRQQAKVFRWFRTWISEGLFTAIES